MSEYNIQKIINGVMITEYLGYSEEVIIPSMIDGECVTAIGCQCFYNKKQIKKIVMPDTITKVEDYAFERCESLEEVYFSSEIRSLGKRIFRGSKNVINIYLSLKHVFSIEDSIPTDRYEYIITPRRMKKDDTWDSALYNNDDYIFNSPSDHIISGYNMEYDPKEKIVYKTDDGLYYFKSKDGLVITHGDEPYCFLEKILSIPEEINGEKVVAIGTRAFQYSAFLGLELPETIEVISALAFENAQFDFLRLPTRLKYLNNYWVGRKFLFDKIRNKFLSNFDVSGDLIDFSYVIVMPKHIQDLDKNSLDCEGCRCIYHSDCSYELPTDSMLMDNVFYEHNSNLVYRIENDYITLIFASKIKHIEDIPKKIKDIEVKGLSTSFINSLRKTYFTLNDTFYNVYQEDIENDEDEFNKLVANSLEKVNNNQEIIIPTDIKYIYRYFNDMINYYEDVKVIFHDELLVLEGINVDDNPFVLPHNLKKLRKCKGTFIAYNGTEIKDVKTKNYQIISGVERLETNEDYIYVVRNNEVSIIKYIGINEVAILPSEIEGLPVKSAKVEYKDNVTRFIFDNIYYQDSEKDLFDIKFKNKIEYFEISGALKRINVLTDFIEQDTVEKIILQEGIEEILGDELKLKINEKPYEEDEVSISLPKSLIYVGKNGLRNLEICYIDAYEETIFDDGAIENFSVINYKKIEDITQEKTAFSINGNLISDYVYDAYDLVDHKKPDSVIEKILDYELLFEDEIKKERAYKVLESNKFYDFRISKTSFAATYMGTIEEHYIHLYLNDDNKLQFECLCPYFYSKYGTKRCKHINGLVLYIKKYFSKK